jgi:hypothetical protein
MRNYNKYIITLICSLFITSCSNNKEFISVSPQYSGQTDLYEQLLIDISTNKFKPIWQINDVILENILNKSNMIPLEYKDNKKINQELKTLSNLKNIYTLNLSYKEKFEYINDLIYFKENLTFLNVEFYNEFCSVCIIGLSSLLQGYWTNQDQAFYVIEGNSTTNNITIKRPSENYQISSSDEISYFNIKDSLIIFGYYLRNTKEYIDNFHIILNQNGMIISNLIDGTKIELNYDSNLIINNNNFSDEIKEMINIIENFWYNFSNIETVIFDTLYYDKLRKNFSFTMTYKNFGEPEMNEDSYVVNMTNNTLNRVQKNYYFSEYMANVTNLFFEQKSLYQKNQFNNEIKYLVLRNLKSN